MKIRARATHRVYDINLPRSQRMSDFATTRQRMGAGTALLGPAVELRVYLLSAGPRTMRVSLATSNALGHGITSTRRVPTVPKPPS